MPIEVVTVPTTIQLRKPRVRTMDMFWPTLSMTSWLQVLGESYPEIMLGGFRLDQEKGWRSLFTWFWDVYKRCDPTHPIYSLEGVDFSSAIPYMVHGDEGRGLRSLAFMVQSWQLVISHLGPHTTNTSGHLFRKQSFWGRAGPIFLYGKSSLIHASQVRPGIALLAGCCILVSPAGSSLVKRPSVTSTPVGPKKCGSCSLMVQRWPGV